LVQPNRDLGAVHVHSIIPAMVQAAPTFDQVLPDIAASEQGRVDLHAGYYDKLVERILADVIIVDEEALLSEMVADALNLEPQADTRKGLTDDDIVVLLDDLGFVAVGEAVADAV